MPTTAGPSPDAATATDLALARAARAWGLGTDGPGVAPPSWRHFAPAYRDRLATGWAAVARLTPEQAWQALLRDHASSSRPDPRRVHPTWSDRILRAESPAVRRLVAEGAGLPPGAHPEAVAWARALWAERLVGDAPEASDDPPIVLALSRFPLRSLVRLARAAGHVKQAFAAADLPGLGLPDDPTTRAGTVDRVRVASFRRLIGRPDPRLVPLARGDFAAITAEPRRKYAAVGLITLARLIRAIEAHRARWAIQHIPYPVAKLVGTLGGGDHVGRSGLPARAILAWEAWILEAAWARLLAEGRLGAVGTEGAAG